MTRQYSPVQLKELVLEARTRSEGGGYFLARKDDSSIMTMISRNPMLFGESCQYLRQPGAHMEADLYRDVWESMDDKELTREMVEALKDPQLCAAVNLLMDEELKMFGQTSIVPNPPDKASLILLFQKAKKIWAYRIKLDNPGTASSAIDEFFTCYVTVLSGAQAESQKMIKLFVNYNNPFERFLEILQDATWNCIIPPPCMEASKYQRFVVDENSQDPSFRPRSHTDKGYTLLDGPWIYRIGIRNVSFGLKKPIACRKQYSAMVGEISEHNKKANQVKDGPEHVVMIMHALEVELIEKIKVKQREKDQKQRDMDNLQREEDEAEEKNFLESCRNGLIVNVAADDEEDWGIPYTKHLKEEAEKELKRGIEEVEGECRKTVA